MIPSPVPHQIGPYHVVRPIAHGGLAQVYEVQDPATGEHMALKLLLHQGVSIHRFRREYEAMIRINHPTIARTYYYGIHQGQPWFTMELIAGMPVHEYLAHRGPPGHNTRVGETIRIGHDTALALHHVHQRGLVHRDLKSANLLVLPDGRIKLIDFGSARVLDAEVITLEGEFVGTYAYASPEQLAGRAVDVRSDLYSFGALLYRLLTGKRPFDSQDPYQLAQLHLSSPPKPPRDWVPSLPQPLCNLIVKLLSKNPDHRPASGVQVADTLASMSQDFNTALRPLWGHNPSSRLVGREQEHSRLRRFLDDQQAGSVAVLCGLPGSGCSALFGAAIRDARARDWNVMQCIFEPEQDFMRFSLLLHQLSQCVTPNSSSNLLDVSQSTGDVTKTWNAHRSTLEDAGLDALRARHAKDGRPVLIGIEALHNASAMTLELLTGLRNQLAAQCLPVVFVADYNEMHPTNKLLVRNHLGDAVRIALAPLGPHQVGLLVGSLLHCRPPPADFALRLTNCTGGMPEYIEESVLSMVAKGLLTEQTRDPNRLAWDPSYLDMAPPRKAANALQSALQQLPRYSYRVLEVLAIVGHQASIALLAKGMGWHLRHTEVLVADLIERGWIHTLSHHTTVCWRRPLTRAIVDAQMNPCTRRSIEERLVDPVCMEPTSALQVRLLLAVHRTEQALTTALAYSQTLLKKNQPASALKVLEPAIARCPQVQTLPEAALATLYQLAATALVKVRPSDPLLTSTLTLAQHHDKTGQLRASLALVRAEQSAHLGEYPTHQTHLANAWAHVDLAADPALASQIATALGRSALLAGSLDQAATWHTRAEELAQQTDSPRLAACAQAGTAALLLARGLLVEAEDLAVQALEVLDELEDQEGMSLALPVWVETLLLQGRFSQILDVLNNATPLFRPLEVPTLYARLLLAQAWCELEIGRLGKAQECVDELLATLGDAGHLSLRLRSRLVSGRILLASGMLSRARQVLSDVCTQSAKAGLVVVSGHARALLAETLWESNHKAQAKNHLDRAQADLATLGHVPALMAACRACARIMASTTPPDSLFEPVASVLASQPVEWVRIAWALAKARYLHAQQQPSFQAYKHANQLLTEMSHALSATDKTALDMHPWARAIRGGLVLHQPSPKGPVSG